MNYSLLIRPEARADIAESQKWYEERASGLGREFVEAVDETLLSITKNPWPILSFETSSVEHSRSGSLTAFSSFWQRKQSSCSRCFTNPATQNCGHGGPKEELRRIPNEAGATGSSPVPPGLHGVSHEFMYYQATGGHGVSPECMYYFEVAPNPRAIAVTRRRLAASFVSRCSSWPMSRTRVEPSRWAYRAIRFQEIPPSRFPM